MHRIQVPLVPGVAGCDVSVAATGQSHPSPLNDVTRGPKRHGRKLWGVWREKGYKVRVRKTAGKVQNGSLEITRWRAHTRQANCKPRVLGARRKPYPLAVGGPCTGL